MHISLLPLITAFCFKILKLNEYTALDKVNSLDYPNRDGLELVKLFYFHYTYYSPCTLPSKKAKQKDFSLGSET